MAFAPRPVNELQRVEALHSYQVLDSAPEAAFDEIVFLAAHICQTPIALVTMLDGNRQWFKARTGTDVQETERDTSFCAYAILDPEVMTEVPDATRDARFRENPMVVGDPHVRFYAGVPLVTPDGFALGTLCTIDVAPRTLDDNQRRALRALASEVTTQLELRRALRHLENELLSVRSTLSPPPGVPASVGLEVRVRNVLERMAKLQHRPVKR